MRRLHGPIYAVQVLLVVLDLFPYEYAGYYIHLVRPCIPPFLVIVILQTILELYMMKEAFVK